MIRKVIVISFSLLMLPALSQAQCADKTSLECSQATAVEVKQNEDTGTGQNSSHELNADSKVTSTTQTTPPSRKNKRRTERQFPRFETADPRDTVLSSEICVYSSATYTYTCR